MRLSLLAIRLDDADSVGDVERVVVFGETAVRLLGTIRADERVHLQALNVVHTLDGILDLLLVRARVDDEDQRVVGFNLRHGALRRERVLQDLRVEKTRNTNQSSVRVIRKSERALMQSFEISISHSSFVVRTRNRRKSKPRELATLARRERASQSPNLDLRDR